MDCQLIKKGVWSRAMPNLKSRTGSLKLNNPFVNEKPFVPSYEKDKRVDIRHLYHCEYHRLWTKEHDEYLMKRKLKFEKATKKQFPIYRKAAKMPTEVKPDLTKKTNKKYANVKAKVKTFFPKKTEIY